MFTAQLSTDSEAISECSNRLFDSVALTSPQILSASILRFRKDKPISRCLILTIHLSFDTSINLATILNTSPCLGVASNTKELTFPKVLHIVFYSHSLRPPSYNLTSAQTIFREIFFEIYSKSPLIMSSLFNGIPVFIKVNITLLRKRASSLVILGQDIAKFALICVCVR